MAKVGEGDPRWIVTDRGDGKNVNSWHWEEKDLSGTAHDALKQRFKDLVLIDTADLKITVKEISEISGDCTVAQRKGKIMCYFGLKVTLKWKATVGGATKELDGKMAIEEVEHDNFRDAYDISVTTTDNDKASDTAAQWVRAGGRKTVRSTIQTYFEEVFKQYNVGSNVKNSPPPQGSPAKSSPTVPTAASPAPKPATQSSSSSSTPSTSLQWKMQWRVPIEELFSVLTNEQRASMYTRSHAKIDPRAGGTFEFLGGVISGYYVDVQYPNKLTMQWRLSSWASGVFSSVVIVLTKEEPALTTLEFAQAGIPSGEYDRVKQGWQVNFFDPIKMLFGFAMEYL